MDPRALGHEVMLSVLTCCVAVWSLFTYATPAAAAAGTLPLLAARVMLGVGEGVAFPSIHSLIGECLD